MGIMRKIKNSVTRYTSITKKELLGTGLTAAFTIILSHLLGGKGRIVPSEKNNIAAIGVDSQAWFLNGQIKFIFYN